MCLQERVTVSVFGGCGTVDSGENVAMLVNISDPESYRVFNEGP